MSSTTVLKLGSSVLRSEADLPLAVHEIYREWRAGRRVLAGRAHASAGARGDRREAGPWGSDARDGRTVAFLLPEVTRKLGVSRSGPSRRHNLR